jgi:hypothetical protein
MITADTVRSALYEVWGQQACQRPADWPDAFARFMAASNNTRTSLKPRYEAAIATLTEAYGAGIPPDGEDLIWRAFAHLDPDHGALLHRRLVALVDAAPTPPTAEAVEAAA